MYHEDKGPLIFLIGMIFIVIVCMGGAMLSEYLNAAYPKPVPCKCSSAR